MKKKGLVLESVSAVIGGMLILGLFFLPDCEAQSGLEPYKVGLSGTVTGGAAGTYTPMSDGFRLYLTELNDRGGVNGRKTSLVFEDNAGVGVKAGANIRRFANEKVHINVLCSPSGTFAPSFEEAKRVDIPVLMITVGPHETVPPKTERLVYGQVWGNAINSAKIVTQLVKEQFASKYQTPVWGIGGIDIPVSRKGAETQGAIGQTLGMGTVVKIAPLGTMDYTPIATAMMNARCNIVSTYGPAGLTLGIFKSLQKLGYKDVLFIDSPDPPENFIDLMKENSSIFYVYPNLVPLWADLPIDREIKAKAEKHGVRINSGIKVGWWYGMLVEEVFKRAGWPVTTEKLLNILEHLDLNFGPSFPPIQFTSTDHQGPVFRNGWSWNPKENKFVVSLPWYVSNAAGTEIKVYPKSIEFPKTR